MRREQIEAWVAQGYNVLEHRKPKVVQGDIWSYLNQCDGHGTDVISMKPSCCFFFRTVSKKSWRKHGFWPSV